MKNVFYFTLEALFVLKIFKILSWLFDHADKQVDWKDQVNFKFYYVTTKTKAIAIHILLNIPRSKSNQTMKFCQLIEYNMRNILLEKSCTRCGEETISRRFFEKLKLNISLIQQFKLLHNLFLFYGKLRAIKIY